MPFSPRDFAEDTDYERFVLDRLGPHRVRVAEPGFIYHDEANPEGGRRGNMTVKIGPAIEGAEPREELRRSLRPVGFGAAYKILDMLLEHVLRANGVGGARMTFAQKTSMLSTRPTTLPVPFDRRPELWDRLAPLYRAFQEARHAVTHRRAQVTPAGDLEVYDRQPNTTDTIAGTELAAFSAAVHTLAEAVVDIDADERRTSIAAWHLNMLGSRYGFPPLAATNPDAGRRLLVSDLAPLENGLVRFDVARAGGIVAHQQPPSFWDLELRAGQRMFVGRWEDVPDSCGDEIDFHPASPPSWLSEQAA